MDSHREKLKLVGYPKGTFLKNYLDHFTKVIAFNYLSKGIYPDSVFEFGACWGRWLKRFNCDARDGVDQDKRCRELAEEIEGINVYENWPDRTYDLCISITALQHNTEDEQALFANRLIRYCPKQIILIEHQQKGWKSERTFPREEWTSLFPNYTIKKEIGVWYDWPFKSPPFLLLGFVYQFIRMKMLKCTNKTKHIGYLLEKNPATTETR